jgi:hypothetical protein
MRRFLQLTTVFLVAVVAAGSPLSGSLLAPPPSPSGWHLSELGPVTL